MTDERSLTEFSSTETAVGDDTGESSESSDGVDKATSESTQIEPATITYRWEPEGAACSRCGTSTHKQWLNDGQFVCPDCKTWDNA